MTVPARVDADLGHAPGARHARINPAAGAAFVAIAIP
jgi:hypothetical protein